MSWFYFAGMMVGGFVPTFLLSRLILWTTSTWHDTAQRLVVSHSGSILLIGLIGGLGLADGGAFAGLKAIAIYSVPQAFWLAVDLWRFRKVGVPARDARWERLDASSQSGRVHYTTARVGRGVRETVGWAEVVPPVPQPQSDPKRFNNFVARYWRGDFSLGMSYWVFGLLGGIVVALIPILAATIFSVNAGFNPHAIFAAMAATWIGVLVVTIWQLVGVWRSANRRIDARIRMGKRAPWAGLAKLAVILGVLGLVGQFANTGVPQLNEVSRIAFMGDPDLPAYSIRIMRNGTEAEITGDFKHGLTDDFVRIMRASPQIRVVHLNS